MNPHRTLLLRSTLLAAVLVLGSIGELASRPLAAHAQAPVLNLVVGAANLLSAGSRRRGTYVAADQNQREFNQYYDRLRNTARTQLVSGELRSLRSTSSGLQSVRVAAYVKLDAALRAEQAAVTRAIEAEKNEARRIFNSTVVRTLTNVILSTPGAQQLLGEVRTVISNLRASVVALQSAIAAGLPYEVIREQLANQVSDSTHVQNAVRNLGTMLGQELDDAMGGALTRIDQALSQAQQEMTNAAAGLDDLDAQVASLSTARPSVLTGDRTGLPFDIRMTDRANAMLDAASSAYAFFAAIQDSRGTTRDQMYQQIRSQMLQEHNVELLNAQMSVRTVTCNGVGRGEYEVAMGMLGRTPGTVPDPEDASYIVCTDRKSGHPVHAYIVGGGIEAAATPGEGTQAGETVLHAGTYVGEAEFPDLLKGPIVPEATYETSTPVNVVRVIVHEDGRVEGDLSYEAQETFTQRECSTRWDYSVTGTFGGSLTAAVGSIPLVNTIEVTWTPILDDCGVPPGSVAGTYTWDMQVQVEGDYMTGAGIYTDESGQVSRVTFEAHKE